MKQTTLYIILFTVFQIISFNLSAQEESLPAYPGGEEAFSKYFADSIKVPDRIKNSSVKPNYNFSFSMNCYDKAFNYKLDDLHRDILSQVKELLSKMRRWKFQSDSDEMCEYNYKVDVKMTFTDKASCSYSVSRYSPQIYIMDVKGEAEPEAVDIAVLSDNSPVIVEERYSFENPFATVEQMPRYVGGESEMFKFIGENMQYPAKAQEYRIQGRVVLRFVVDKDGSISDVQILRSLDPECDKEAVRVVKAMPKWKPGKQNGREVPVYFTLPIMFKLENIEKQDVSK
ncbi:MAG: energy transducer TonB [Dysgonomonas sp.]